MGSINIIKSLSTWAVVVVQLAERLLPTPENRSLNPDVGNENF